jgi:hypothetical protein
VTAQQPTTQAPPPKWSVTPSGAVLLRGMPLTMKDGAKLAELVAEANRGAAEPPALEIHPRSLDGRCLTLGHHYGCSCDDPDLEARWHIATGAAK